MSSARKPDTVADHGKRKKTIVVVLEVPDEKSLEETEEELKLLGHKIKSIEEVVFRAHKKGGGCNEKKNSFCKTGKAGKKNLIQ